MPVGLKPIPHAGVLVVGGIVPDQNGSPAAIVASQLFQESKIGRGVEDGILPVMESGAGKFKGTQNLYALTFSGDRDFGWVSDPAPGGMQSRVLAETGFVREDQRPVLSEGLF